MYTALMNAWTDTVQIWNKMKLHIFTDHFPDRYRSIEQFHEETSKSTDTANRSFSVGDIL